MLLELYSYFLFKPDQNELVFRNLMQIYEILIRKSF